MEENLNPYDEAIERIGELCKKWAEDCGKLIEEAYSKEIPYKLYEKLQQLGILDSEVRSHNVGNSDYSRHLIQPWTIWIEYNLNSWDADIVKRVLRTKEGESRKADYEKIIHDCQERIRQLDLGMP